MDRDFNTSSPCGIIEGGQEVSILQGQGMQSHSIEHFLQQFHHALGGLSINPV